MAGLVSLGCSGGGSSSGSASATAAASSASLAGSSSASSAAAPASASVASAPSAAPSLPPPQIASASLSEAYNDRAVQVTLDGRGFYRGATARWVGTGGAHLAITTTVQSENRIVAEFPPGAPAGSYVFEVETAYGIGQGPSLTVSNLLDVDAPGALAVGYEDRTMTGASGDSVDLRIYYPALTRGRQAPAQAAAGPFPVVVLAHAFKPFLLAAGVDHRSYSYLSESLASFGYVVVSPDLSTNNVYFGSNGTGQANSERDADDLLAALEHVTALGQDPNHPLFALVDGDRVGLLGHSRGACAALIAAADEVLARGAQTRVRALAALAPPASDSRNGNAPLVFGDFSAVPTLLVGSSEDGIAPLADQQAILNLAGSPAWLFEIAGGSHSQYKDSATRILGDGIATLPAADQRAITRRYVGAWLQRHVKGLDLPVVSDRILRGPEVLADARLQSVSVR